MNPSERKVTITVRGSSAKMVRNLKTSKKKFSVERTTSSTKVCHDNTNYLFTNLNLNKKKLFLIKQVKKETHDNIIKKNIEVPLFSKPLYFKSLYFSEKKVKEVITFNNCINFDINKAYYVAAYNLGYISKEFYENCLVQKKSFRLILIGSLATRKTIFRYNDGKITDIEVETDELLRRVFFHISEYIDRILFFISDELKESFIMYWVDGIYLKDSEKNIEIIKKYENLYNLNFSFEKLKKIKIYSLKENDTYISVKSYNNKKEKVFSFPNLYVKK